METFVIKSNTKNKKLIRDFALKHGAQIFDLDADETEDFLFGKMIQKEETNELISRDKVMELLDSEN